LLNAKKRYFLKQGLIGVKKGVSMNIRCIKIVVMLMMAASTWGLANIRNSKNPKVIRALAKAANKKDDNVKKSFKDASRAGDRSCDANNKIFSTLATILSEITQIQEQFCGPVTHINQQNIPLVITQSGKYILDEDIHYTTTAITISASAVELQLCGHTVRSNNDAAIVLDVYHDNIAVHNGTVTCPNGAAIEVVNNSVLVFDHLTFNNSDMGLSLTGNSVNDVTISDCAFTDIGEGINVAATTFLNGFITRSRFSDIGTAIIVSPDDYAANMLIEDCNFFDNEVSLLFFSSQNINVHNCSSQNVGDGCVFIDVWDGMLKECQFVGNENTACYISEESYNIKLIDCLIDCQLAETTDQAVLVDGAQNVTFERCHITNESASGFATIQLQDETGIVSDVVIQDCIITNTQTTTNGTFFGIYVDTASNITIDNVLVDINSLEGEGAAIQLNSNVNNVLIKDCHIPNNSNTLFDGIRVQGINEETLNTNIIIDHCFIEGINNNGIHMLFTNGGAIKNNVALSCIHNGISLDFSENIAVTDNISQGSGNDGVFLIGCFGCVIRDNIASGNDNAGFKDEDTGCNSFSRNFAFNNGNNYVGVNNTQLVGATYVTDDNTFENIAC
jgi:parallel beta-helix repeat protein